MTTKVTVNPSNGEHVFRSIEDAQHVVDLEWKSREKWYAISRVTLTHNPEFPTPAISIIAPQNGIRFTVYNQKGEIVYTNKKGARADDRGK